MSSDASGAKVPSLKTSTADGSYRFVLATAALHATGVVLGTTATERSKNFLRVTGAFDNERDIEAVNFVSGDRTFRLGDIATVRRGFADPI